MHILPSRVFEILIRKLTHHCFFNFFFFFFPLWKLMIVMSGCSALMHRKCLFCEKKEKKRINKALLKANFLLWVINSAERLLTRCQSGGGSCFFSVFLLVNTESPKTFLSPGWERQYFGAIEGFDGSIDARRPNTVSYSDKPEGVCCNSPSVCRRLRCLISSLPAGHRVNDGLWHTVSVDTRNLQISLTLDSEPPSTVELWEQPEAKGVLHFGGGLDSKLKRKCGYIYFCLLEVRRIYWFTILFEKRLLHRTCPASEAQLCGLWHHTADHMFRCSETNTTQETTWVTPACGAQTMRGPLSILHGSPAQTLTRCRYEVHLLMMS